MMCRGGDLRKKYVKRTLRPLFYQPSRFYRLKLTFRLWLWRKGLVRKP